MVGGGSREVKGRPGRYKARSSAAKLARAGEGSTCQQYSLPDGRLE